MAPRREQVHLRIERGLLRLNPIVLGTIAALLATVKSGVTTFWEIPVWGLDTWPEPIPFYPYLAYGYRIVGKLTGADSQQDYLIIAVVAWGLTLVVSSWAVSSVMPRTAAQWALLVMLSGPLVWVLAGGVGRIDPLVVMGGILIGAKGRQPFWAIAGAVIAALGNPEMSVVIALSVILVSLTQSFRAWRPGAVMAGVAASVVWGVLRWWAFLLNQDTRDGVFSENWKKSAVAFFSSFPLELYAGFGMTIILVLWGIVMSSRWERWLIIVGALVIPLTLTITTTDQSRVMALASSGAVSMMVVRYGGDARDWLAIRISQPLTATLAVVVFLPAVEIQFDHVMVPWAEIWPYLARLLAR